MSITYHTEGTWRFCRTFSRLPERKRCNGYREDNFMWKTWKSSALFWGTAVLGALALSGNTVEAGDVPMQVQAIINSTLSVTATTLNFGEIDVTPAGDTITIDAHLGATTTAVATNASPITPASATSGLITVSSANGFTVDIVYPSTTQTLTGVSNGDTLSLTNIGANSTATPATKAVGAANDLEINVGGVLTIPAGVSDDTYECTITITLNYS